MAALKALRNLLIGTLASVGLIMPGLAATGGPSEHQVKAVFVFNFSHFVEWPAGKGAASGPFTLCVLGSDPIAAQLEQAVRGEKIDDRPLLTRRLRDVDEVRGCQILFIDRSESAQLERILTALADRSTLTVSDLEGAATRGAMIQFLNDNNRIRLLINVDAAKAAGLTISSNLLRPAEIVQSNRRN